MAIDPTDERPPIMSIQMLALGDVRSCADPTCELDASVLITTDHQIKKPWCTGHAHCEISVWMVGL
jgi:hypothetical protein